MKSELVYLLHKAKENLLQHVAVVHFLFLWFILPLITLWLPLYVLFFTRFWWAMILYFTWAVYDLDTPRRGSRKWNWYKTSFLWKYLADYFPLSLVKTVDLPQGKNYIVCCHPHGVFSIGAFVSFCTNATGFDKLFPGRELGIGLGGVESSHASLTYLLKTPIDSNQNGGRMIAIVVGGAEEALDAHPGKHDLTLNNRRGFCKFALRFGTDLVPAYSFGENDVFAQVAENPRGTRLRKFQSRIKKLVGFCPPLFIGASLLKSTIGIFPRRVPITTVIGKPIPVEKVSEPSQKEIDELHARYCDALVELFESNKTKYGVPEDVHLNIF
uniref:Acyltransferase n=1 Tax=Acrobeloides nanus TaxID=290746 RepID=A0A914EL73_9BILA